MLVNLSIRGRILAGFLFSTAFLTAAVAFGIAAIGSDGIGVRGPLWLSLVVGAVLAVATGIGVARVVSAPLAGLAQIARDCLGENGLEATEVGRRDEVAALSHSLSCLSEAVQKSSEMTEAARAESANLLHTIQTPIMAIDREFNVTLMNSSGARAVGRTPESCLGEKCYNLMKTDHCRTSDCRVGQAMERSGTFTGETVAGLPDGDLPIRYTGAPLKDQAGEIVGGVEYVIDISGEVGLTEGLTELAEAALAGKMDVRADPSGLDGTYRTVLESINQTLDTVGDPVLEALKVLEVVAEQDLSRRMEGEYRGDHARIKRALNQALDNLDGGLSQVALSADQVASAAEQIATGSQALAQGTSEQASSLEEVAASLQEVGSMAEQSAGNAREAKGLSDSVRTSTKDGVVALERLSEAMARIKSSSDETAKIVKTIDEVAFQTNLLALNAAVEAARAGDAGKGFAVVAEEVRNLAMRSAEAAKSTALLIEESVTNAENGVAAHEAVKDGFDEITENVVRVSEVMDEVAAAADQQLQGIEQVNVAVEQMNQVTQQTAANAEESSSASEELTGQAEEMRSMSAEYKLSRRSLDAEGPSAFSSVVRRAVPTPGRRASMGDAEVAASDLIPFGGDETQEILNRF